MLTKLEALVSRRELSDSARPIEGWCFKKSHGAMPCCAAIWQDYDFAWNDVTGHFHNIEQKADGIHNEHSGTNLKHLLGV